MKVISLGLGRTGTMSLKLALERLGYGPCYHMIEVATHRGRNVPLWQDALDGNPDWETIFDGYSSSVDWPTASFGPELYEQYPDAKFIITTRNPQTWAESFGSTIAQLISAPENAPPDMAEWLSMSTDVIARAGVQPGMSLPELEQAFEAHTAAVKALIPAAQLLEFQVKQGWAPLCKFLGQPVPDEPFPRTNNREEFWDLVSGAQ